MIQSRPYNDSRSCTQIPAEPIIAARAGENHPRPATGPNVDLQPLSAEGTTPLEAQLVLRGEDGVEIPAYGIILLELRYEPGAFARMKHSLGDGGDPIPDDALTAARKAGVLERTELTRLGRAKVRQTRRASERILDVMERAGGTVGIDGPVSSAHTGRRDREARQPCLTAAW